MTRPRRSSGVSSWTSVDRKTAEKTSAAPASARQTSASGNETVTRPNAVIARPQPSDRDEDRPAGPVDRRHPAREQRAEERPGGRRGGQQSEPGRPRVPKTSRARTGKSDVGIPKIIALRSMTNEPRIARR